MGKGKFFLCRMDDAGDFPVPVYQTEHAAGMDLYANIDGEKIIRRGEIVIIPTGIKIALPPGFEAQIRPRSGLAAKYGVTMVNSPGTIDADYRGEISVVMINLGSDDFTVNRGDRIAQMVIGRVEHITWEIVPKLDNTERGAGGFGHTGV